MTHFGGSLCYKQVQIHTMGDYSTLVFTVSLQICSHCSNMWFKSDVTEICDSDWGHFHRWSLMTKILHPANVMSCCMTGVCPSEHAHVTVAPLFISCQQQWRKPNMEDCSNYAFVRLMLSSLCSREFWKWMTAPLIWHETIVQKHFLLFKMWVHVWYHE